MQILEYIRAPVIAIGLLAAIPGTPGCLRYECIETDITCKPQNALLWLLGPLPTTGRVAAFQKISSTEGGFTGPLDNMDRWGIPTSIGDLDRDGVPDLLGGANLDDDGGAKSGGCIRSFHERRRYGLIRAKDQLDSGWFCRSACERGSLRPIAVLYRGSRPRRRSGPGCRS